MRKFLTFFLAALLTVGVGWAGTVTDVIDYSVTLPYLQDTGTSSWQSFHVTGQSGAEYVIRSMGFKKPSGSNITGYAIRWSSGYNSYMYSTKSPGTLKSIKLYGASSEGKAVNIFAKNSPFSSAPDAGTNPSGALTTLKYTDDGNEYIFTTTYAYLGMSGRSSSTQIVKIEITWETEDAVVDPVEAGLSYGEKPVVVEAKVGDEIEEPTLINPNGVAVTYRSSDETVAKVDAEGNVTAVGAGEATITATFAGNDEYLAGTASYTIVVTKKDATVTFSEKEYTVYVGAEFTEPTLTTNPEDLEVSYSIAGNDDEVVLFDETDGTVVIGDKPGTVTITATFAGDDTYKEASDSYTITVIEKKVATLSFDVEGITVYPDAEEFTQPKLTTDPEGLTVTYSSDDEDIAAVVEGQLVIGSKTGTATITATFAGNGEYNKATATYTVTVEPRPVVAVPTLDKVAGSYSESVTVTIACATEGATISYSTDGGQTWTTGNTVTLTEDATLMAKAEKEGMTASTSAPVAYIIDKAQTLPQGLAMKGYYSVKNNGNEKYVNVAGRKTVTFKNAADIAAQAGTVVYVETNDNGQVQSLRSQAADLQGYANRAMNYVPEIVQLIVDKLHAEGAGELLGQTSYEAIMEKFDESFDHHLYVEPADGGYRLYGKTPSMQPVVNFYRDNQAKVEAKLPMLEQFINDAIDKVLEKTNGHGSSILQHFSLHETWQRMGGTLTEPVDEASTMLFYQEVLNNKNYVWDFAYQTAMTYWERVKSNDKYESLKEQLGEFAQYLEKIEQVRPDFKYYVVADGDNIDYVSEGNKDLINGAARTMWTLEPRTTFAVNFATTEGGNKFFTTLYTDFAYDLPDGVTAYKVTEIDANGIGQTEQITGTIPAQTPVLLKATGAGEQVLTLNLNGGAAVTGNLLVGNDYFINEFGLQTEQMVTLFSVAKDLVGDALYDRYIAQYEHLMALNAGTVGNKYFWGLTKDQAHECIADRKSVIRALNVGDNGLGFYSTYNAGANQAFLASSVYNPVKLNMRDDVTRDGKWDVADVSAVIDMVLGKEEKDPVKYDLDAADFDGNGKMDVADVSAIIDYILGK